MEDVNNTTNLEYEEAVKLFGPPTGNIPEAPINHMKEEAIEDNVSKSTEELGNG